MLIAGGKGGNELACSARLSGDLGAERKLRVERYIDFADIPMQVGQRVSRQRRQKKDARVQGWQVERDRYQAA